MSSSLIGTLALFTAALLLGNMILLNDSVVEMLLAFIIFHEEVPFMVIIGGVCVFLSTIIPVGLEHKKQ